MDAKGQINRPTSSKPGINAAGWDFDPSNKKLAEYTADKRLWVTHGIGSFNVVFSGERPATTGAHCDINRNI
jgi:hypothetical protein